jgi:hypothetical protein
MKLDPTCLPKSSVSGPDPRTSDFNGVPDPEKCLESVKFGSGSTTMLSYNRCI